MVHNGIEYGDMQLIAKAYDVLRSAGGLSNAELAAVFDDRNHGELESFLVEITSNIFRVPDELGGGELVDKILDKTGMKGTGEYRAQAARIREILDRVGLARDNLSPAAAAFAQVVAPVANLLNIRDTGLSSFIVANGDLSLRKTDAEKGAKVQKESKVLLEYARKTITKLTE